MEQRLDFLAVCPGAWLMPARMIINTESTVGYNNKFKQGVEGMKLGVNSEVNPDTKKVGVSLMEGGPSRIKKGKALQVFRPRQQDLGLALPARHIQAGHQVNHRRSPKLNVQRTKTAR